MREIEPEGLYPSYRCETTKEIVKLISTGQIILITAQSGSGKSKYLRYLSSSKKVFKQYFQDFVHSIYYIDLNCAYKHSTEEVEKLLTEAIGTHMHESKTLEERLQEATKGGKKVYFIIDHLENLDFFDESTPRFLRALRDKFKYKVGYILSYKVDENTKIEKLNQLLTATPYKISLPKLSKEDSLKVLKNELSRYRVKITPKEITELLNSCDGVGRKIRDAVVSLSMGSKLSEVLKKEDIAPQTNLQNKNDTSNLHTSLTKNEYLVYTKIHDAEGNIVTRDAIASLLCPKSEGLGVSNESIDQLISRLRKKLQIVKPEIRIVNKKGFGFYLTRELR